MKVAIRKMGDFQWVLIPQPVIAQLGLEGMVDLQVRDGLIEIRPIQRKPREGWAADAQAIAESSDGALVWPEFANVDEAEDRFEAVRGQADIKYRTDDLMALLRGDA